MAAVLVTTHEARSQSPGKVGGEIAEMAVELIGAPVFTVDGTEIGTVVDIHFGEDDEPRTLRISAARQMGFGTKVVDVPKGAFILVRGAAVLELTAASLPALPARSDEVDK